MNLLKTFSINNKMLYGEYFDSIFKEIKIKYEEVYNNTILVKYHQKNNIHFFDVYTKLPTIHKEGLKYTTVKIASYTNIEAIKLFSTISMEEYLNEYDDSKKDYLEQLKDYIKSVQTCYMLIGIEFAKIELSQSGYNIFVKKPIKAGSKLYFKQITINGNFKYNILTLEEYLSAKQHIAKRLKIIYED